MSSLFSNLLTMSIAGSIVVGLLLLLRPLTVKAFSASWQYGIGKIAIAFFLIPVFHLIKKFSFLRPVKEIYPVESSVILKVLPSSGFAGAMNTLEKNYLTMELKRFILFIWFMGLTMLLNVKKMKKHIVVVAVVTMIAIAGIGSTISVLAADHIKGPNPNEGIDAFSLQLSDGGEFISKELEKHQEETEPLTENEKMSTEGEIINTKKNRIGN